MKLGKMGGHCLLILLDDSTFWSNVSQEEIQTSYTECYMCLPERIEYWLLGLYTYR